MAPPKYEREVLQELMTWQFFYKQQQQQQQRQWLRQRVVKVLFIIWSPFK